MLQTTNRKLQQQSQVINRTESTKVAIMIEVTSRLMECTLLTPDFSQVPAVALQRLSYFLLIRFYSYNWNKIALLGLRIGNKNYSIYCV